MIDLAKAGIKEIVGKKGSQIGAMSGLCKLLKESLAEDIVHQLNKAGVVVIPLPESSRFSGKLSIKACQQFAISEFEKNIVLLI
jgi:hypothetical protein